MRDQMAMEKDNGEDYPADNKKSRHEFEELLNCFSKSFNESACNSSYLVLISSASTVSPPLTFTMISLNSAIFLLMFSTSVASSFSLNSSRDFSVSAQSWSALLTCSIASFLALSCSLNFSASLTIFSISASDNPEEPATVMELSFPDALSLAETLMIPSASMSKFSLTLEHSDFNRRLTRSSSGENLGLLGWNSSVSWDQSSEDTTQSLNTERQWSNVQKQDILNLTRQHSTLNSGTNGNSFIWVDSLRWLLTKQRLDGLDNLWHSGHTTNKDNLGDLRGREPSILQSLLDRLDSLLDQWLNQLFKLRSRHLQIDVLWTGSVSSDERKVDLSRKSRGQLNLGLLSSFSDSLNGHSVVLKVDTGLLLESVDDVSNQSNVKVLTTQVSVTIGGLDLKDTVVNVQDGDIEGTSTQVEHGDDVGVSLLQTVSQSSSSRFVDNSGNVQTNNSTCVLGGLSLSVVEVCWNSHDSVLDRFTKVGLGSLFHLVENETSDLSWGVFLASGLNPSVTISVLDDLVWNLIQVSLHLLILKSSTDQSLCGKQGVLWVDHSLSLGWNTDQSLTVLGEGNDRRSSSGTLGVLDDSWSLSLHHSNSRIGGSQIDTDHGTGHLGGVVSQLSERRLRS
ncbi:hypothetical protein OGATHE_002391 [Ogataea polymorpha]|uniref:Uncharacterized protein n=1 Tax=Ogataea polymorpha TaxID=460523 RepID=A0A9P8PDP7_9ASCO|nr:hypothetical protein OGATHE_002391 [Ogataea polymorpha]